MQISADTGSVSNLPSLNLPDATSQSHTPYSQYKIIRRNGAVVGFEPSKISIALTKAFLAVNGGQGAASARVRELVAGLTDSAVGSLTRRHPEGGTFHIEDVQDQVELALMRSGEHDVCAAGAGDDMAAAGRAGHVQRDAGDTERDLRRQDVAERPADGAGAVDGEGGGVQPLQAIDLGSRGRDGPIMVVQLLDARDGRGADVEGTGQDQRVVPGAAVIGFARDIF